MKKFLSILLSITMLLSITAGIDFSAFADDSDRIDMSDVSYKPHGIFKNDLYYTYDYDLVYYFSDSDEEDGYVLSKDDDFVEIGWASMDIDAYFECLYGDDDFNNYEFLDEPESYDEDYCLLVEGTGDFKGDSFLFVEGWNPTLTAEDGDDNGDENGDNNDEESDIKSIIFTPNEAIEIAEFTNGSLENVEGVGEYWEYNIPGFKEGDILTVVTKDDEVKNYIYKGFSLEVFDDIFVNQADKEDYIYADDIEKWSDQQSEPWEKDKENYYTISYHGAQYDVLVSIVENNVKSISFTPVVPAEYTEYKNGYYEENNDGELFWCYSIPDFNDGDILTVTDKNGVPTDYTFVSSVTGDGGNFISKKAGRISTDNIRIYDDQYNENWTVGTNYYVINYMASECIVPVTITETQVASIDFNPVSTTAYPEETNGYFNEDLGYFVYYDPQFNNGDELIVTHKDGTKYTYTYMVEDEGILGSFVDDKNDDVISIFDVLCYSQQENTPWVIDGNNYYFVSYSGATTNVPVVIKENKIQDIQVECNTKLIYQDSDEDFSFSDYASNLEFTLNITYKDDTTLSTNVRDGDIVDGEKFNLYFAYPEDDSVYYYCEYYGSEFELSTPIVDHSIVDSIEV